MFETLIADYGIMGMLVAMFAAQLAWLQKSFNKKLDDQYDIIVKLIDRHNKSDDAGDRRAEGLTSSAERRHEALDAEINDISDDLNFVKARVMNGKPH